MPSAEADLRVGQFVIPDAELTWSFSPSGGPGGQHANRSSTRAELRFDLDASEAFPQELKARMIERLGTGTISVVVDDTRSQWRNRSIARRRLSEKLLSAMRTERPRRPTKPTGASKRRRLESKRRRGETKRLRGKPEVE
jgi:ribosome-associated protein